MLIGVCGKSGSGKSTLANEILKTYSDKVIHCDIDRIGHNVLTLDTVKKQLVSCFGKGILDNNTINRKSLSKIVFNSTAEMEKLTDITWKQMQKNIDEIIKNNEDKIIILDWLLLPKSKYFNDCHIKILLDIPYEIRKQRAMARDNITEEAFDLREKASYTYRNDLFDIVINSNSKEEYERIVKLI